MKILRKILNGLDYIFYRTAKAYYKWDGNSGITSYLSTSLFLTMLVFVPTILSLEKPFIKSHDGIFKGIMFGIQIIMLILVTIRYRKKYEILHERYKSENENTRKTKGAFVVLTLLTPWIVLIVGSIMRK